jgi:hypothetical protein
MKERLVFAFRRLVTRLSVSPFRLVAYVLHATGLERIYKPRFNRYSALLTLTDEVIAKLPRQTHSMTGVPADPINLIFVADEADLKLAFKTAKWYRANPASPFHLLYGMLAVALKRSYRTGPFAPLYVNIGIQDLAYQRVTRQNSFRRRHHIRIWRTGIVLPGGKRVWIGAASYDTNIKLMKRPPFMLHDVDPNLDKEREYVVRSLENQGAASLKTVEMMPPAPPTQMRRNDFVGSDYFTDGRATVVEI